MRFILEIDDDWLDTLDDLTAQVEAQGDDSPEQALEKALFAQIKGQRKDQAAQEPLPATPILSALALIAIIASFWASSLGRPDWTIILIAMATVLIVLVLIDKILILKHRKDD